MIEVDLMYDFKSGIDMNAYLEWAKKTIDTVLHSPGLVEFRASRNVLGNPHIRTTTVWKSLADWGNFFESEGWKKMEEELRTKFAHNVQVGIWGPSPVVPEPLKP